MTPFRRALRLTLVPVVLRTALLSLAIAHPQEQSTPYWAYVLNPPNDPPPADPTPLHVPNSSASFTFADTQDYFRVADWHPNAHPPMPSIVAIGRKPDVYACAFCHLPNGQGKPENSSLAGLPAAYLMQQMADFKSGERKSSEPRHIPAATMIAKENNATPAEIQSAARYFSSLKYKPWIRVVETKDVPITHAAHFMLVATPDAAREPIGHRIIEMAEHPERTELRDDASPFVAYVPIGSLRDGQSLVASGSNGRTFPCGTCHGANLRGFANVPSIAGRSPSYMVRQLLDMQSGARSGPFAKFMQPVVAHLTLDDIIAIAAYLASLRP